MWFLIKKCSKYGGNLDQEKVPRLKEKKFTEQYNFLMTKEMKSSLVELKMFKNIDVPEWIRSMVQRGLDELSAEKSNQG